MNYIEDTYQRILFCRIGWAKEYKGATDDILSGGGEYNNENVGHECYNFQEVNNEYYGFVQVGGNINLRGIDPSVSKDATSLDNVIVIWYATHPRGGQKIVGWYMNATVFSEMQTIPDEVHKKRENFPECNSYYITSSEAVLIPEEERRKYPLNTIEGSGGRHNLWHGNDTVKKSIISILNKYYQREINEEIDKEINDIEKTLEAAKLEGAEREALLKTRVNQGIFRKLLINKYGKCCLCDISNKKLLIASHLKPWAASDKHEKLNVNNGLLLCANHDKLVDSNLISFENDGKILISNDLSAYDRKILNIPEYLPIKLSKDNIPFVEYHRNKYFEKQKN